MRLAILKRTTIYASLFLLILNLSCKTENKSSKISPIELDSIKTAELIFQILEDEKNGFLEASYITEKPVATSSPMVSSFGDYVTENLKITDSLHYKYQFELYKKFSITKELAPNKIILTEVQLKEFENKSRKGVFNFWEWLDEKSNGGFCSISKPIFNETFDLAYVQIGTICGSLCGGGEGRIYEYKNGKWIEKEKLRTWVS